MVKITIMGKAHNVSCRLFLLNEADRLFMPKFDMRNIMINDKDASKKTRQIVKEKSKKTRQVVRDEIERTRHVTGDKSEKSREEIRTLRSDLREYYGIQS